MTGQSPSLRSVVGRRLAVDGSILGVAFTAVVLCSLIADPVAWLSDYPPDVRAAAGETAPPSTLVVGATGLALLLLVLGGFVLAVRRLERDLGRHLTFPWRAGYALLLFLVVNLFDVAVVDWLIFAAWTPSFLVIPGTEGAAGYDLYWFHVRQSFLRAEPWVGSVVVAALVALLGARRPSS